METALRLISLCLDNSCGGDSDLSSTLAWVESEVRACPSRYNGEEELPVWIEALAHVRAAKDALEAAQAVLSK
jgi:hypothetical protein